MAQPRPRWRRPGLWFAALLVLAVTMGAIVALVIESVGVSPRLLAPYIERRSSGHHPAIEGAGRIAAQWLTRVDRGTVMPRLDFPRWSMPPSSPPPPPTARREVVIISSGQLAAALEDAHPGDVITFVPGTYRFRGHNLQARRAGGPDAPITVRAPSAGSVVLEFDLLEGFHVSAPYWVFENLTIVGTCRDDNGCEHAFHVVGEAHHVSIRHNEMREFNAHVKVNGAGASFPDQGQLVGNRLFNTRVRRTDNPVTPFDLVAASGWLVEGNLFADFVKGDGDQTSYGAFAKGAGDGNRFVRNVVLCEHRLRGVTGRRVGLSLGGGGTGASVCRDRRCVVEQDGGVIRDNLIASCSDDGIYVNRGARSEIRHNTLIDTAGINVRFPESSATVEGNLVDGPLRASSGGLLYASDNLSPSLPASFLGLNGVRSQYEDALALDLRWRGPPPRRTSGDSVSDLCGQVRGAAPAYGAFEDLQGCANVSSR